MAERRTRALATSLLLVLPALLLGCRPKASYVRSEQGGYSLVATAPSVEQAVIRIRRTAEELCLERDYGVSEPQVLDRDFDTGILGMYGSRVTVRAYLSCSAGTPPAAQSPAAEPPTAE